LTLIPSVSRSSQSYFYSQFGYTEPRTHEYEKKETGKKGTNTITVWTERGRKFLHEQLKNS